MQIQFKSRSAARAFGKAVDNGAMAVRRWGVDVHASSRQRKEVMSTVHNISGSPVLVIRKGAK